MSITSHVLAVLSAWESKTPIPGGLAFEPLLRRCRLDWSLASLGRVDLLLDALRKTQKLEAEAVLASEPHRNMLRLLAFYTGELVGRGLRQAPEWFTDEEMLATHPAVAMFGPGFITSIGCRFPGRALSEVDFFFPLNAIVTRLVEPEGGDRSVRFAAGLLFDQDEAAARQPLPPLPPQHLGIALPDGDPAAWRDQLPRRPAVDNGFEPLLAAELDLLRTGRVVWGAVVQANTLLGLSAEGGVTAPGEVLYDPQGRMPADDLAFAAEAVASLKGQRPGDPAWAALAAHLEDGSTRVFGMDVPAGLSVYPLKMSSAWFDSGRLPGGRIAQPVFPIVISDAHPGLLLVLPQALWPEVLREAWIPPRAQEPPPDAAPMDPVEAMFVRGARYAMGAGVARDVPAAIELLRQAAEQGHPDAQITLARLLLLQNEPTHDRAEAGRWLHRAVEQGSEEAEDLLTRHALWGDEKPASLFARVFGRGGR